MLQEASFSMFPCTYVQRFFTRAYTDIEVELLGGLFCFGFFKQWLGQIKMASVECDQFVTSILESL